MEANALLSSAAPQMLVSICVPAFNEEKNIGAILDALLHQKTKRILIHRIVVVSSGSTDDTNDITSQYEAMDPKISLIRQADRFGKASAINAFLKVVDDPVVVVESADTIPDSQTIERLCVPFLKDNNIGLTGGAPIPINDADTFLGYVVHTWWWFHRNIPRFGEIIAFRNLISKISPRTAVDEAFIQAKIIQMGFKAVHIDSAIVHNKGPETVADLIKQRRRIFNGHSRLFHEEGVKIDNMTKSSISLIWRYKVPSIKHHFWLLGGVLIEIFARLLGTYDAKVKKINPFVWDTAMSTKELALEEEDVIDDDSEERASNVESENDPLY
jgi:biofilm PGA synthesis N-glycosyltransferase PgaC